MIASIGLTCLFLVCADATEPTDPSQLALRLLDAAPDNRPALIQQLRDRGPAGLAALLALRDLAANSQSDSNPAKSELLSASIDAVAAQRDACESRLYWYTDFQKALAAANEQNKPILSLRLLGNLTDEMSCANSRFFRTTLYPNAQVSAFLRDNVILHWESVRPVPRISIDFGDGRKLSGTITGNSIHYILDQRARLIDAIPGLYAPQLFLARLQAAMPLAHQCASVCSRAFPTEAFAAFHRQRAQQIVDDWQRDLARIHADRPIPSTPIGLQECTTEADWNAIATTYEAHVQFDDTSVKLIQRTHPTAEEAALLAVTKTVVEQPFLRLMRRLTHSVALDSVRNEYLMHRRIHERLAQSAALDVGSFNDWVYASLFQTPLSDPWMGLSESDVFTALENGGRSQ